MLHKYILLFLSVIFFVACKDDKFTYPDKLDGEWTIERSERMLIHQDGSVEVFEDIENAGKIDIFEPSPPAETLKEFTMDYTNFLGEQVFLNSLLYTDEVSSRVMMSKVLCDSPFECDIVWTVDTNKKNKQVWSTYGNETHLFYPPDRYDPSNDNAHLKWRITLKRD